MIETTVLYFPRLTESGLSALVADIDARIFKCLAMGRKQRRKSNIEAGRWFFRLKTVLGSGKWIKHFDEVYAPSDIELRSVQRWMRLAREIDDQDNKLSHDKLSYYPMAMDAEAVKMRAASEQAEEEVGGAARRAPKRALVFRFSLSVPVSSDVEWNAAARFWKSKHRSGVVREMIKVFRKRQIEYGFVNSDEDEKEKQNEDEREKQNEDALVEA
jgi:hypothetical protein